jgi:hypothetical protein
MAGYRRARNILKLRFEEEEFNGLEVMMKPVDVGMYLNIAHLAKIVGSQVRPEDMDRLNDLFVAFADHLISWNLEEEDGTPVPATFEGVKSYEIDFMLRIIGAWLSTVGGVPRPLGKASPNGESSPELSIPMEALSPSP